MEFTAREIELIDGMIEVQIEHASRCDTIANRAMAEKQKAWDLERVALLEKIKSSRATDPLLNEMSEAFEEIVRCLSHGLQDCRASVTAKAMLQKYHEQEATNEK